MNQMSPGIKRQFGLRFIGIQALFGVLGLGLIFTLKIPSHLVNFSIDGSGITKTAIYFFPTGIVAIFFTSPMAMRFEFLREIFDRIMVGPFGQFIGRGPWWSFITVSILAGAGEELVFRGVVQNELGLVAAALIFGFFHFVTWGFFAVATAMGLYLGNIFLWTHHNLAPPMLIHAGYDLLMLCLIRRTALKDGWAQP